MPEGKDFVDELAGMSVVDADAVADVEGSFECLPAGFLWPHRKIRGIVTNAAYARHALSRWRYLDAHNKMAFQPDELSHWGRLKRLLSDKSQELHASAVRCGFSAHLFPSYHAAKAGAWCISVAFISAKDGMPLRKLSS
jgi:hypothetical protein